MRLCRANLRLPAIISQVAFGLQLLTNYGSAVFTGNALFPRSIGEVAKEYQTRISPAPFAFPIIWGIIYFFQLLYVFRPFLVSERRLDMDILFPISCIFNITWVIVWTHDQIQAALGIFVLLWVTLFINWILLCIVKPPTPDLGNFVTLLAPVSLYFGWVTFAINANLVAVITLSGKQFSMTSIVIISAVITVLGWLALAISMDVIFCAGAVWGLAAVLINASWKGDKDLEYVMALAITSFCSAVAVRLGTFFLRKVRRRPIGNMFLLADRGASDFISVGHGL